MTELITERLIQKVSNMLEEMSDLNLLVRRLPPSQELLNKLNERVESVQTAVGEMEKVAQQHAGQLGALEEQLKPLAAGIAEVKTVAASLEGEVRRFAEKESVLPRVIDDLKARMQDHEQALRYPSVQKVQHHHYTDWSIVISAVLFLACILQWVLLSRSWTHIDLEKERDIKYRYLETMTDIGVEKLLHRLDSAYIADPDKFEHDTKDAEEHQQQEWEAARQLEHDKEGLRESQEKEKVSEDKLRKSQERGKGGE